MMRRFATPASIRRQSGFGMVDAMISLVILTSVITVRFSMERRDSDRIWAGRLGHEIRQVNDAVASLLSSNPTFPVGTYTDFNFLRHTSCVDGTAGQHYLPCAFTVEDTLVGRFYTETVVTQVPNGAGTGTIQIGTSEFGPIAKRAGESDSAIAGLAGAMAQGYSIGVNSPVYASTRSLYSLDKNTATITAVTSSDPTADQWYRRNGDNTLTGDATFETDGVGNPQFDITGANDVVARRFMDHDDTNFLIDPAGASRINDVNITGGAVLSDAASISTSSGDLDLVGAAGVSLDPGAGRVIVEGSGSDEGILEAKDIVVRDYNTDFTLAEMLPSYSAQAAFIARSGQIVVKPDCPAGAGHRIMIGNGLRVGWENADQIVNNRVFATDFACDGAVPSGSRTGGCQGTSIPANGWMVRYTNPINGVEYEDDQRIVMTYCYFPRSS